MIPLIWQIWIALALDFLLGDPRWLPHPVCLMGRTALALETPARRLFRNERLAGIVVALVILVGSFLASWGILFAARSISPLAGDIVSIWIMYTAVAARDLGAHSRRVLKALDERDIPGARAHVSYIVGRDTENLNEAGVVRATVESVAENTVDGVLAPLLFAVLFGPVGALTFKAVSTLDSTFGYKNERYERFGWASARLDDIANFIPARLSLLFIAIGAALTGNLPVKTLTVGFRDARKHASPNAGFSEAAFAGALGIQLGGPVFRAGIPAEAPLLGNPGEELERHHISKANAVMIAATITATLLLTITRGFIENMSMV